MLCCNSFHIALLLQYMQWTASVSKKFAITGKMGKTPGGESHNGTPAKSSDSSPSGLPRVPWAHGPASRDDGCAPRASRGGDTPRPRPAAGHCPGAVPRGSPRILFFHR